MNINDLNLDILLKEKSYENNLIYEAACKTPYGATPWHIIFDIVDGYIRKYGRTKFLALLPIGEKYEREFDRIRYQHLLS